MLAMLPLGRSAFSSTLSILPLGRFPNRGLASAESGRYDGRMFLPTFFSIFCYKQQTVRLRGQHAKKLKNKTPDLFMRFHKSCGNVLHTYKFLHV